jgi:hypothetical protein
MKKPKNNRKGQVAIWVILALVLAAAIILFFALERLPLGIQAAEFEPAKSVEGCIKESIAEAVSKMLPQGGFIQPKNFVSYNKTNIEYLCENPYYFSPCTSQHPMLISEMNREIKEYILPFVEECFEGMREEAERRGYSVEMKEMNLSVEMAPGRIYARISREFSTSRSGVSKITSDFDSEVLSPAYELANVAMEIAASEAKYCYFESVGYMLEFPQFDIRKTALSTPVRIYSIKDTKTGAAMNIAIRSCAIPAGMGLK